MAVTTETESSEGKLMGTVTESVDVGVPVRTAYDQWTQFEEFPRSMEGVTAIRQLTPTMTHWSTDIAGVKREFDAEITEQLPDERVAWRSIQGAQQAGDKLGMVDRRVKGDLKRFKDFIEDRGGETTGGWRGRKDRPQP
jgi:uncharacterized membrane protein